MLLSGPDTVNDRGFINYVILELLPLQKSVPIDVHLLKQVHQTPNQLHLAVGQVCLPLAQVELDGHDELVQVQLKVVLFEFLFEQAQSGGIEIESEVLQGEVVVIEDLIEPRPWRVNGEVLFNFGVLGVHVYINYPKI